MAMTAAFQAVYPGSKDIIFIVSEQSRPTHPTYILMHCLTPFLYLKDTYRIKS